MSARVFGMLLVMVLMTACETHSGKPDPELASQPTPQQISRAERMPAEGILLIWTGKVQAVRNLARVTHIEVLSFPADTRRRPVTTEPTSGRFIAEMAGFLEPRELPLGTAVTVQGTYVRTVDGKVGEAAYRYPLIRGQKLDVWHTEERAKRTDAPDVRWSIGVGSGGSGVGVGIGF